MTENNKKKILFISSRDISIDYQPRNYTIISRLQALSKKGYAITVLSYISEHLFIKKLQNFNINLLQLNKPNIFDITKNTFINLIKLKPLQLGANFSSHNKKKFIDIVNHLDPNIIIFDYIRSYNFIELSNSHESLKILDSEDFLSDRYKQLLDNSSTNFINVLGSYKKFIPKNLLFIISFFIKLIILYEHKMLKKYEKKVNSLIDFNVFISRIELQKSIKLTKTKHKSKFVLMPICVDFRIINKKFYKRLNFYFIGNFSYEPNNLALKKILFVFKSSMNNCNFKIIGPHLSNSFIKKLPHNFNYSGYIENLDHALKDCFFTYCPVIVGTGISTKIIYAIMNGIIVFTNLNGFKQIQHFGLKSVFVTNTFDEINSIIINTTQKYFRDSLESDKAILRKEFSPNNVSLKWSQLIEGKYEKN